MKQEKYEKIEKSFNQRMEEIQATINEHLDSARNATSESSKKFFWEKIHKWQQAKKELSGGLEIIKAIFLEAA